MAAREHTFTKEVGKERNHLAQTDLENLKRDRDHWKREAQMLQLEALRLQDSVQRQQGV